ncbi:hypothetical protein EBU58_01805, partial [bacterium]|nr:hypothetical protein [bacterium]
TLLDFGKVAYGNIVMPVPAGNGTASVHFGEKLTAGRIDREPPGTVRYGMTPIRRGGQRGNWVVPAPVDPRNTEQAGLVYANPPAALTPSAWGSVMPFRWIEVEGVDDDFPFERIRRRAAFSSTWDDSAASFACSEPLLNEIWELCRYSIKATTFAGVYVDGDRERIPYEGDAYLNQLSHFATDTDVTMARRTFDWLMENGTWPTEWSPHMVFMASAEWMHSGDTAWLAHRYESLKTKTLLHRAGDDGLVRSDQQDRSRHDLVDWPQKERDGFVFTEVNTVVNAFHLQALAEMEAMARGLGKQDEAEAFAAQRELAFASFQNTLFDEEAGLYRDGIDTDHSSVPPGWQTATIRPCPSGLAFARGTVPTPRGPIAIDWNNEEAFRLSLTLPEGMTGNVELPATDGSRGVTANGEPIAATRQGDRWIVTEPVSGSVTLQVKSPDGQP